MSQKVDELVLRVVRRSVTSVDGETIVGGVTGAYALVPREYGRAIKCVLFDADSGEVVLILSDEACVEHHLRSPCSSRHTGTDDVVCVRNVPVCLHGFNHIADFADVVRWSIVLRTMLMPRCLFRRAKQDPNKGHTSRKDQVHFQLEDRASCRLGTVRRTVRLPSEDHSYR